MNHPGRFSVPGFCIFTLMKKLIPAILLVFMLLLLSGCGRTCNSAENQPSDSASKSEMSSEQAGDETEIPGGS